ncbi:MAG: hypothetical protein CTY22_00570 [Methylomonas sp.]|nr:MAG: hypothetical protein CTY22_00570 [Methylomonas sp.]
MQSAGGQHERFNGESHSGFVFSPPPLIRIAECETEPAPGFRIGMHSLLSVRERWKQAPGLWKPDSPEIHTLYSRMMIFA